MANKTKTWYKANNMFIKTYKSALKKESMTKLYSILFNILVISVMTITIARMHLFTPCVGQFKVMSKL